MAAGLEGVVVRVQIAEPDRRGRRQITIDVDAKSARLSADDPAGDVTTIVRRS
jgi:hypothetical protein